MPDFLNLNKQNVKYLDALTYATIRSFWNTDTGYAYPPYEKIMERSGIGRTFLSQSIKRLENADLLTITHSDRAGTCNRYHFGKLPRFERIPYELFEVEDLTIYEKALLLCLRQFFNEGLLQCNHSITAFADLLGVSYRQVHRHLRSLISKGYIQERAIIYKHGTKAANRFYLSDKLNWKYDYLPSNNKAVNDALLMVG